MKKGKIKNKGIVPGEDKAEEKVQEESGQMEAQELLGAPEVKDEEQPETSGEEEQAPEAEGEEQENSPKEEKKAPPKKKVAKGELLIRIRPGRGVGGYGQAGWEGPMPKELAEKYAADGYLEILEQ